MLFHCERHSIRPQREDRQRIEGLIFRIDFMNIRLDFLHGESWEFAPSIPSLVPTNPGEGWMKENWGGDSIGRFFWNDPEQRVESICELKLKPKQRLPNSSEGHPNDHSIWSCFLSSLFSLLRCGRFPSHAIVSAGTSPASPMNSVDCSRSPSCHVNENSSLTHVPDGGTDTHRKNNVMSK